MVEDRRIVELLHSTEFWSDEYDAKRNFRYATDGYIDYYSWPSTVGLEDGRIAIRFA